MEFLRLPVGPYTFDAVATGPADGRPVILLHGFPQTSACWLGVLPILASAGYRVIVPYLRGYGSTRFLSSETDRNGQQSVVALDIIAHVSAVKFHEHIVLGPE